MSIVNFKSFYTICGCGLKQSAALLKDTHGAKLVSIYTCL